MALDFGFLAEPSGFGLSEGWLPVTYLSTLWQAILAGLLNTLKVALPALVLTTALGLVVGLARVSKDPVLSRLAAGYVSLFRNVPLLLQLLAIYFALPRLLPPGDLAWSFFDLVFLSRSGLAMPVWSLELGGWDTPIQGRFTVEGGAVLTPEYLAVFLALTLYTGAFAAEIVRAGVESVPTGLRQAGLALGLTPPQVMHSITLPVGLRLMIPPMGNQYLNLLKNASLGVAVGYPELVSVSNTAMNQTGRVLECVLLVLGLYALLSLFCAWLVNLLNARTAKGLAR